MKGLRVIPSGNGEKVRECMTQLSRFFAWGEYTRKIYPNAWIHFTRKIMILSLLS